jgi:hypothetical protein
MESAAYTWGRLRQLPEGERNKKERQLWINLDLAMETLADSLAEEYFTVSALQDHYGFRQDAGLPQHCFGEGSGGEDEAL